MAATLSLDTITSSGSTITVPTGKTLAVTDSGALTIGGSAITSGSSNILRKTTDYTILEADVSGKSELVIATSAAAANRTITLPAVATTGLANCIVTIVCDADATSTFALKVQDIGTTEVWTGYQKGDFIRLIVSNSVWLVVDHKETILEYRYLTASQGIAGTSFAKWNASTSMNSIGNAWDAANNRFTVPFDGYVNVYINISGDIANEPSFSAGLKIGAAGSSLTIFNNTHTASDGRVNGPSPYAGYHKVTATHVVEPWIMNNDDDARTLDVNIIDSKNVMNQFAIVFTRTY
jgi:hypothetical protein